METPTNIKINGTLYPAKLSGSLKDRTWDDRESLSVTAQMTYAQAAARFVDGLVWGHTYQPPGADEAGNPWPVEEYDDSEYSVAGPITDNRDGTITARMGKPTAAERLAELVEVLHHE